MSTPQDTFCLPVPFLEVIWTFSDQGYDQPRGKQSARRCKPKGRAIADPASFFVP
jgi:hypothetical protein